MPKHEHNRDCQHGTPSAIPASPFCPVCRGTRVESAFCSEHHQWECRLHVSEGVHHNPAKAKAAREEDWMSVTKQVAQEGLGEVK